MSITLKEILDELPPHDNAHDLGDMKVGIAIGPDTELVVLSIYRSDDNKTLWIDVEEKDNV